MNDDLVNLYLSIRDSEGGTPRSPETPLDDEPTADEMEIMRLRDNAYALARSTLDAVLDATFRDRPELEALAHRQLRAALDGVRATGKSWRRLQR